MAKLPPRLLGIVLLACSGGSTLAHLAVYKAARHGPAQVAEFSLALLTFILASTGILPLIHGAKLFKPVPPRADDRDRHALSTFRSRLETPITPLGRVFDTRHGASMMQARHAIVVSRRARSVMSHSAMKPERTSCDWAVPPRR